jgi:hypothetical protein
MNNRQGGPNPYHGGADFLRPWTEAVYGIPPSRWSAPPSSSDTRSSTACPCVRAPEISFVDDKAGRP